MSRILLDPSLKLHLDGQVSKVVKYFSLVRPKLLVCHDDSDVEWVVKVMMTKAFNQAPPQRDCSIAQTLFVSHSAGKPKCLQLSHIGLVGVIV